MLTCELFEPWELLVAMLDSELRVFPLPLLELIVVSPEGTPVFVDEVTATEPVAPGATPAVIVTGTAPASVPKVEYETVAEPPDAPVARMEPLQTP